MSSHAEHDESSKPSRQVSFCDTFQPVQVLTSAFNTETIEKDERKGQSIDWHLSSTTTQFVLGAAEFADEIFKCMQERPLDINSINIFV